MEVFLTKVLISSQEIKLVFFKIPKARQNNSKSQSTNQIKESQFFSSSKNTTFVKSCLMKIMSWLVTDLFAKKIMSFIFSSSFKELLSSHSKNCNFYPSQCGCDSTKKPLLPLKNISFIREYCCHHHNDFWKKILPYFFSVVHFIIGENPYS